MRVAALTRMIMAAACLCGSAAAAEGSRLRSASGGTVHALVVGINDYAHVEPKLQGSVGDARDLAETLRQGGVADLQTLFDAAATRPAFVAAMERLLAAAHPGDLAIVTYSGHGATVPAYPQYQDFEPSGRTEEFIMVDYAAEGPGTAAVVTNKEMKAWLARLDRKGVDVLFLADSCFGGGMVRGAPDPRAGPPLLRVVRDAAPAGASAFQPIAMTPDEMRVDVSTLTHVTVLSGADRFTPVPEVFIPSPPTRRGALSFAVARALRGGAEAGPAGITRRQLFGYVRQEVQQYSDDQRIEVTPTLATGAPGALDQAVFGTTGPEAAPAAVGRDCPAVQVAVMHDAAGAGSRIGDAGVPFRLVDEPGRSDLVWDVAAGEAIGSGGDLVASNIGPDAIAGVIQRTAAVACVKVLAATRPQTVTLRDGVRRYTPGDAPVLDVPDMDGRYLIVFDIAADGRLEVVWPPDGRHPPAPQRVVKADTWTGHPAVIAPFGADHVVAVSSTVELRDLLDWLNTHDGALPSVAGQVPGWLRTVQARDAAARIGAVTLYTGAKP